MPDSPAHFILGDPRRAHFMKKNEGVSREFGEFLVNTHLSKLRCW